MTASEGSSAGQSNSTARPTPPAPPTHSAPAGTRTIIFALLTDAALICIFAALGRNSHGRDETLLGLFTTAWPFLAGLVIAWVVLRAWKRPLALVRTGIPAWLITVALGMVLRWLTGSSTALAFILVATGTLALFMLGWRAIALLALRLRRK